MKQREYTAGTLIKRFLPYYKKYWGIVIFDLVCAGLTTLCDIVLPMIMRFLTNTGMSDISSLTVKIVLQLGLLYFVLKVVDCGAQFYMADIGHVMGCKIETDMRSDAYQHLLKLSDTYYNNTKIGQIMGRITNDLFDVTEFSHHCPEEFFIAGIKIVVSFVILMGISPGLTLIIFAIVPVMALVCITINLKLRDAFREQRNQIGELNARIEDSLLGQKVVKTFTNENKELEKFNVDNHNFLGIKKKTYFFMAAFQTTTRAFDGLMYVAVIVAGGCFLVGGGISSGDLVAYVLYVSTMIATIRRIIEFAEQFQRGLTGIERFLQIMDADVEIFDGDGAIELQNPQGNITFTDVAFSYPDDKNQVFKNLNLSIQSGEKIAIVGPSGGGKTTLCNLIPRFYDIDHGTITLDGTDIRDFTVKSLRQSIGMVQQDVYLFSGTVLENIAYGKENATREEIIEAAKRAGAHEFIMELKNGYDTYVGERGVKLSGGQKQRISIARVFLKNPPILILDEATSALDNESEYLVAKSLNELAKGRTTIVIAHRLSSIRHSDRILVLTEDGIVEEGNHEQLLEKEGIYYNFYKRANEIL